MHLFMYSAGQLLLSSITYHALCKSEKKRKMVHDKATVILVSLLEDFFSGDKKVGLKEVIVRQCNACLNRNNKAREALIEKNTEGCGHRYQHSQSFIS